ncbi:vacuolar membrane-associated protein iml1 [Acrasis kona]|uniref:Vacuolar membrane-associated protein iml1 n=1 Tax=Acrasis kona TaxID=1008807 RepID=A0AAW2ZRG0_9EUKA
MDVCDYALLNTIQPFKTSGFNQDYQIKIQVLVRNAKSELGVTIKDRYSTSLHPKCFVASEFTTWLCMALNTNRLVAVRIAQNMQESGLIESVGGHQQFRDDNSLFRFKKEVLRQRCIEPMSPTILRKTSNFSVCQAKPDRTLIVNDIISQTLYYKIQSELRLCDYQTSSSVKDKYQVEIKSVQVKTKGSRSFRQSTYCKIVLADKVISTEEAQTLGEHKKWIINEEVTINSFPKTCYVVFLDEKQIMHDDVVVTYVTFGINEPERSVEEIVDASKGMHNITCTVEYKCTKILN